MSDLWSEISHQRRDFRTLPTVIVGNKCDLQAQKVIFTLYSYKLANNYFRSAQEILANLIEINVS